MNDQLAQKLLRFKTAYLSLSLSSEKIEENWEAVKPLLPRQDIPYGHFLHRHEFLFAESVILGFVLFAFFTQKSVPGDFLFPVKIAGYQIASHVPIIQHIVPQVAPIPSATSVPSRTPTATPTLTPTIEEKRQKEKETPTMEQKDKNGRPEIRGFSTEKSGGNQAKEKQNGSNPQNQSRNDSEHAL